MSSDQQYWAFISYSSKDKKWGQWLHKRLENYPIPEEFRGSELFDGAVLGKNLRPVFRDRDELSGSSELGPAIEKALRSTRFLIVLCSKNSAQSEWVNKEIADFKAMGKEGNILALILDGDPNASSQGRPEDECFPPELRYPIEPLAGDLRKEGDGKERGFLKVLAGIAQLDFDKLYRRHERAQARKRLMAGVTALSLIALFAGLAAFAFTQREIATSEKDRAERQLYATTIAAAHQFIKSDNKQDAVLNLAKSPEHFLDILIRGKLKRTIESSRFTFISDAWISEDQSVLLILGDRIKGSFQPLEIADSQDAGGENQKHSESEPQADLSFYLFPLSYEDVHRTGDLLEVRKGIPARSEGPAKGYRQSLPITRNLYWNHDLSVNRIQLDGQPNTGEELDIGNFPVDPEVVMTDIHQPIEWGRSPGNTYFWLQSYDRFTQSDEFVLIDVSSNEVLISRSTVPDEDQEMSGSQMKLMIPLVRDIDFSADERLLALLDLETYTILLIDLVENKLIKRLPFAEDLYDHNAINLIQEFEGINDRIIVGHWLLRRSDFQPIINIRDFAFSQDGDIALSVDPLPGDTEPTNPEEEASAFWVEVTSRIRGKSPPTLSDQIRKYQMNPSIVSEN